MIKTLTDDQIKSINKILIIQQKPFGDILLNTGYFAELRRKFPDSQIDYLIQKPYKTILEDNPHLDNLILMEKGKGLPFYLAYIKTIIKVRKSKYDLVIDQLRGTSSARFVAFCGSPYKLGWYLKPKKRMGFTFNRWNWLYNLNPPKGKMRYYGRLKFDLLKPLGIEEVPHNLEYHVKEESFAYIKDWLKSTGLSPEKVILFSPGTPVFRKQWSLDYYAELADQIHNELDFKVVILWGPGEDKDANDIAEKMQTPVVIAPPTTFNQAGALLNYVKILIGNDGGIIHLAISQNTPSIAIFGPSSNPKKWSAWHKKEHMYLRDWSFKKSGDNTFNIKPQQVVETLTHFLNSASSK